MMNAKDIVDIMFKLRGEAYSIWTLVFAINGVTAGWLTTKDLLLEFVQKTTINLVYLLFAIMFVTAFAKTYGELTRAARDLNRLSADGYADDGVVAYWRTKDWKPHIWFACVLNVLLFTLITALIWRP
jgi:hypothetical protein